MNKATMTAHPGDLVLIPAYKPDESLLSFAESLLVNGAAVLVIDDGSGAEYAPVFDALPPAVERLGYAENRGKGYAMKYGFCHIRDHMPAVQRIVTADADGQHSPPDTLGTLRTAEVHPDALALGVRSFPENTPLRSRIGNRLTAKVFRGLSGIRDLEDTQTGLRAFSRDALDFMIDVPGERYEYEMKVLMDWSRSGRAIVQYPIETIYRDAENSTSHYNPLLDSARIFRALFQRGEAILFAISGFLSFLVDFAFFNLFLHFLKAFGIAHFLVGANVMARIVSSTFNFAVNRRLVFDSKDTLARDALQYFGLVLCLLALNSGLLYLLGEVLSFHPVPAKLMVEATIFVLSYLVQQFYIFADQA